MHESLKLAVEHPESNGLVQLGGTVFMVKSGYGGVRFARLPSSFRPRSEEFSFVVRTDAPELRLGFDASDGVAIGDVSVFRSVTKLWNGDSPLVPYWPYGMRTASTLDDPNVDEYTRHLVDTDTKLVYVVDECSIPEGRSTVCEHSTPVKTSDCFSAGMLEALVHGDGLHAEHGGRSRYRRYWHSHVRMSPEYAVRMEECPLCYSVFKRAMAAGRLWSEDHVDLAQVRRKAGTCVPDDFDEHLAEHARYGEKPWRHYPLLRALVMNGCALPRP